MEVSRMNFINGEENCNKLLGGHLAAFRDEDELDFLMELTRSDSFSKGKYYSNNTLFSKTW